MFLYSKRIEVVAIHNLQQGLWNIHLSIQSMYFWSKRTSVMQSANMVMAIWNELQKVYRQVGFLIKCVVYYSMMNISFYV